MSNRIIIAIVILAGILLAVNLDRQEEVIAPQPQVVNNQPPHITPPITPPKPVVQTQGTITGVITLTPACGVQANPPLPNCDFRSYESAPVKLTRSDGLTYSTTTNTDGKYSIRLNSGTYTIKIGNGEIYPR